MFFWFFSLRKMNRLTLAFLLSVAVPSSLVETTNITSKSFEAKIVGGEATSIENYPYQLSLLVKRRGFMCGAVLIASDVALTAAHCVDGRKLPCRYRIRAGSDYTYKNGITVGVEAIVLHPEYDKHKNVNDIAVLILAQHLDFGDEIQAVKLPPASNGNVKAGLMGHVTGWGDGSRDDRLTVVEVPVADFSTCQRNYNMKLTSGHLCAGYDDGGKDACQGDSGGPFVSQGVLLGIVSTGYGCALPRMYGIYTKVSAYLDFISPYLA